MKILWLILFISLWFADTQDLPPKFRLQHNVIPKSYKLSLRPSFSDETFTGEVTIFVELQRSIRNITLNSFNIKIFKLALDSNWKNVGYELIPEDELLNIFYTDREYIDPGEHFIFINFAGKQTNESIGIFKSDPHSEGKRIVSIGTMFSASEARKAFPCFDEPTYKAKFSVRIIKPNESYVALGNGEEMGSFPVDEGIATDFRTTPPISPYLVCFAITPYNYRSTTFESTDGRIIPIRIFMLDEYLNQAPFLLNVAKEALMFFENYTNITYPVSKLDFIELQNFVFVGMENIGLIVLTHNSISFNVSEGSAKVLHQRNAAQLIVHEIAHMWFGDIVTELWYNDLWLVEGFTQFMEMKGLDHQYSKWKLLDEEVALRHDNIYHVDALPESNHPIVNFPENYQQVEDQFEDLTYSKGSAIVNMLEMVVGPDIFQQGVREFLKKYSFDTATTGEFMNIMRRSVPDINLHSFLDTWLYQNRYPLLFVLPDNQSDYHILSQRNFFNAPDHKTIFGRKWTIPVTYVSNCNKIFQLEWFDKDAEKLYIPKCKNETWIKFNPGAKSFYRVLYTQQQYGQLLEHFEELDEVDQGNLIDDTFSLVKKLQLNCEVHLKFMKKMKGKTSFIPVVSALRASERFLKDVEKGSVLYEKVRNYFISIFKELYEKFTSSINLENHITRLLRYELFKKMCGKTINYKKCREDISNMMVKNEEIKSDLSGLLSKIHISEQDGVGNVTKIEEENTIPPSTLSTKSSKIYIELCSKWIESNL